MVFYHSSVKWMLVYCTTVWYVICSTVDKRAPLRIIDIAQEIISHLLSTLEDIFNSCRCSKAGMNERHHTSWVPLVWTVTWHISISSKFFKDSFYHLVLHKMNSVTCWQFSVYFKCFTFLYLMLGMIFFVCICWFTWCLLSNFIAHSDKKNK